MNCVHRAKCMIMKMLHTVKISTTILLLIMFAFQSCADVICERAVDICIKNMIACNATSSFSHNNINATFLIQNYNCAILIPPFVICTPLLHGCNNQQNDNNNNNNPPIYINIIIVVCVILFVCLLLFPLKVWGIQHSRIHPIITV